MTYKLTDFQKLGEFIGSRSGWEAPQENFLQQREAPTGDDLTQVRQDLTQIGAHHACAGYSRYVKRRAPRCGLCHCLNVPRNNVAPHMTSAMVGYHLIGLSTGIRRACACRVKQVQSAGGSPPCPAKCQMLHISAYLPEPPNCASCLRCYPPTRYLLLGIV